MIKFHYTYLLVALGFILTGYYLNLIVFTSLILIHELGHYLIAKALNFKVDKIIIYPYGGLTKINDLINKNLNHELLISISGILFQITYFYFIYLLYNLGYIREYTINLFKIYNGQIILFNLLPIYPLDGAKIINILLYKIFNYDISNKIIIIISIITIIIVTIKNYYNYNYSNIMIITILIIYLYNFIKKLKYLYNKFLLERYLYKIKYNKLKIINTKDKLYKDKYHLIKYNNKYIKEDKFLKEYFK